MMLFLCSLNYSLAIVAKEGVLSKNPEFGQQDKWKKNKPWYGKFETPTEEPTSFWGSLFGGDTKKQQTQYGQQPQAVPDFKAPPAPDYSKMGADLMKSQEAYQQKVAADTAKAQKEWEDSGKAQQKEWDDSQTEAWKKLENKAVSKPFELPLPREKQESLSKLGKAVFR